MRSAVWIHTPHFINNKKKAVVSPLKGIFPVQFMISTLIEFFPEDYLGVICLCEETFYKLRAKVKD